MEFDLLVYTIICCDVAGISFLMSICYRLDPYFCPSKDGKDAAYQGRNG